MKKEPRNSASKCSFKETTTIESKFWDDEKAEVEEGSWLMNKQKNKQKGGV